VSAFQKRVRGEQTVLKDHICKEMNGLNLERCRCIPKDQPGADWRVLQQIVEKDPSREKFQVRSCSSESLGTSMLLPHCEKGHSFLGGFAHSTLAWPCINLKCSWLSLFSI